MASWERRGYGVQGRRDDSESRRHIPSRIPADIQANNCKSEGFVSSLWFFFNSFWWRSSGAAVSLWSFSPLLQVRHRCVALCLGKICASSDIPRRSVCRSGSALRCNIYPVRRMEMLISATLLQIVTHPSWPKLRSELISSSIPLCGTQASLCTEIGFLISHPPMFTSKRRSHQNNREFVLFPGRPEKFHEREKCLHIYKLLRLVTRRWQRHK